MAFRHNSTISVKKKPCKSCGRMEYLFSKGRCSSCAKIEDTIKRIELDNERVVEEEDLSGLIADADAVFSQYIRLKYANERGLVKCFTCGVEKHWTMVDNGHYVKRGHLLFRLDERNCRPQCKPCNSDQSTNGKQHIFAKNLEKENPNITEYLQDERKLVYKPTREEIRQIISEYSPKVKALKAKLKKTN
jgi:hypothetical protein